MKSAQLLLPIVILITLLTFISCSKSSNSGKPTIKLKTINTDIVLNESLNATFEVQSGTTIDSFVWIRERLNEIPLPPTTVQTDLFTGTVPSYPNQTKVEYSYIMDYNSLREAPDGVIDTFQFKYAVVDKNGLSSDTSVTPVIAVHNTQ